MIAVTCTVGGCECSIGNAPAGESPQEAKASFDKQPLKDRVEIILNHPAPAEEKERLIREMYQKAGQQVPDDILARAKAGGIPAGGPPIQTGH